MKTVEAFETLQAVDGARRRVRVGVLAAPFLSALWALVARDARAIDAGQLDPARLWGSGSEPSDFVVNFVFIALHHAVGTSGLHLIFGSCIAVALGVAVSGRVKRRALEARLGVESIRELERARSEREISQVVQQTPKLAAAREPAKNRPVPSVRRVPRHPALFAVWAVLSFYPHVAILLTALFAWLALKG